MALQITLELSDDDLDYYRKAMDEAWERSMERPEQEILDGARGLLNRANRAAAPAYVRKRLDDLGVLISMLQDAEWPLEAADRRRVLTAVSYFADPVDLIPDKIPGLGFLDDALMAEIVIQELQDEIEGYREFCEYRDNEATLRGHEVKRADWLAAKHRQIFLRIKRRQQEGRRHGSTEGPTDPILRYQY